MRGAIHGVKTREVQYMRCANDRKYAMPCQRAADMLLLERAPARYFAVDRVAFYARYAAICALCSMLRAMMHKRAIRRVALLLLRCC